MNALLALRPCKAFGRSFQASLPCSPLPLHLILPSPTTIAKGQQPLSPHNLPKSHYPLLCTITLASLVKGEVLSPEKIRATTGGIASPPSLTCTNPSKTALSPSLFVGEELAPPVAPNLSIPTTIAKGQQPLSPHNLPKSHYPSKKHYILSQPNLFRTSLTSLSTHAILLLALAKTN